MVRFILLTLLVFSIGMRARADEPYVNPYIASSPSGEWKLSIEPTEPGGAGACTCRMSKGGQQVWTKEFEYTPRECVLSDSGVAVGYAYDSGYMGWGGNVVVLVIGADGSALTTDVRKRGDVAMGMDPPPPSDPRGQGVILDEQGKRAVVRLTNSLGFSDSPSLWLAYGLSDGKLIGEQKPKAPLTDDGSFSREIAASLIPDTGLIAVHWFCYESGRMSAEFQLIDRDGAAVWSRRIVDEYSSMEKYWNWWDLHTKKVRQIEAGPTAEFGIVSFHEGKRTRYALERGADKAWSVREVSKEDARPIEIATLAKPTIRAGTLKLVSEVTLGTPASQGVISEVHSICFDDRGRIGWVRWVRGKNQEQRFTLIDRAGATINDFPLALLENKTSPLSICAWLEKDRWIVGRTEYGEDHTSVSRAWFLDVSKGSLEPLENFSQGSVKRICRTHDGGFVTLGSLHGNYTIRDQVTRYDRDGKVMSSKTEPGYGQGDMINDIAVLSDDSLAILTGVADRSEIKITRPAGSESVAWALPKQLGDFAESGQPYYADIRPDKDGGVVLYDSAKENLLYRLNRDGKCWQSFHVRGPKGEGFRLYDAFAVDPDGKVWAADGSRLFRFDETGKPDLVLGGPAPGTMAEPVSVTLDAKGWIYAVEKGTAQVHVFDESGKPLRVLTPEPGDIATQDALPWIVVDADGTVRFRMSWEGKVVTFAPDGKRVSAVKPPESWDIKASEKWERVRGGGWEQNGEAIRRIDASGGVQEGSLIDHRPDGEWFVSIVDSAAASDGSVAVLCAKPDPNRWFDFGAGPTWLCVYGPNGEGRGTLELTRESLQLRIVFEGTRVLLCDEHGVTAYPIPLKPEATRFALPEPESSWYSVLRCSDGNLSSWNVGDHKVQNWQLSTE